MTPRRLESVTTVPRSLAETWDFFSRPENLEKLTPPEVKFEIVSPVAGREMYEGMIVQYRVTPFPGFTADWVTEITHIRHHEHFIDDQRVGPFALWHHQHHFRAVTAGETEMRDILHYQAPLRFLGTIADKLFVHRQVKKIFSEREKAIRQLFPA
ncbi:SRPBCC family protein [Lewinella sp. JB7]|uniref:SRPBCC family protein n=1 Tax=Lewinella sp. JB7 TaxID=2962887 RepID=UPI0020CA018F|nr:SRPBCC family protein [Lewinella sp. JB7]MCP9236879.1 SRPBCC family protein [Lewinella sp. JB7]